MRPRQYCATKAELRLGARRANRKKEHRSTDISLTCSDKSIAAGRHLTPNANVAV